MLLEVTTASRRGNDTYELGYLHMNLLKIDMSMYYVSYTHSCDFNKPIQERKL